MLRLWDIWFHWIIYLRASGEAVSVPANYWGTKPTQYYGWDKMKEEVYTKFHSKVVSRSISIITYCTTPTLTTQLVRFFTKLVFPKTNTISKSFSSSKGTGSTYSESSVDIFCECKYVSMKTCTPNYGVFCSTTTQYQV